MIKEVYQIPSRTRVKILHSNLWWAEGAELLQKRFTNAKSLHLYRQGIRCVGDIWDEHRQDYYTWKQTQAKFKLTIGEREDWVDLTNKNSDQWRDLFESDDGPAFLDQWLGFYENRKEDPALVFRCERDFIPEYFQWYNVTLLFPVRCYTVGKHSMCLRIWEHPLGEIEDYFYKVKTVDNHRRPLVDGEKVELIFFYGKEATLGWDRIGGVGCDGSRFLEYTTNEGREYISSKSLSTTRAADK